MGAARDDEGAVPPDLMAVLVEFQAGDPQSRGRGGRAGAPQHGPDAFQHLWSWRPGGAGAGARSARSREMRKC